MGPMRRIGLRSPEPADRLMGQPHRLRDTISHCAGETYMNRILQRALVPNGDKDRLDPAPRPDYAPDHLPAIPQRAPSPFLDAGLVESVDQPALGATDRRLLEK
jgi:hypothetical protein